VWQNSNSERVLAGCVCGVQIREKGLFPAAFSSCGKGGNVGGGGGVRGLFMRGGHGLRFWK